MHSCILSKTLVSVTDLRSNLSINWCRKWHNCPTAVLLNFTLFYGVVILLSCFPTYDQGTVAA